jgi:hypothetical protein
MEVLLARTYFPEGTNGILTINGKIFCYTIELPWNDNQRYISCIPEGKYVLRKRYSNRFGWHIAVCGVPNRQLILFHASNHALRELKGCIAPVSQLTGAGEGKFSKTAMDMLKNSLRSIR